MRLIKPKKKKRAPGRIAGVFGAERTRQQAEGTYPTKKVSGNSRTRGLKNIFGF